MRGGTIYFQKRKLLSQTNIQDLLRLRSRGLTSLVGKTRSKGQPGVCSDAFVSVHPAPFLSLYLQTQSPGSAD